MRKAEHCFTYLHLQQTIGTKKKHFVANMFRYNNDKRSETENRVEFYLFIVVVVCLSSIWILGNLIIPFNKKKGGGWKKKGRKVENKKYIYTLNNFLKNFSFYSIYRKSIIYDSKS